MNNLLRKLVLVSFVLTVLVSPLTFAANANPTFSIAENGVGVGDDVVTVTVPATLTDLAGDDLSVVVRNASGGLLDLSGLTISNLTNTTNGDADIDTTDELNGRILIANISDPAVDVTVELSGFAEAANVGVTVIGTAGYGSSVLSVGNANEITVNATVEPILALNVTPGTTSFGVLSTENPTSIDIANLELGTNAVGGATVFASSLNGGLKSTTATWTMTEDADNLNTDIGDNWATVGGAAVDHNGELYNISSSIDDQDDDLSTATKDGNLSNDSVTSAGFYGANSTGLYTVNGPEKIDGNADMTVSLQAQPTALTPAASDYTDTITFTVTASF